MMTFLTPSLFTLFVLPKGSTNRHKKIERAPLIKSSYWFMVTGLPAVNCICAVGWSLGIWLWNVTRNITHELWIDTVACLSHEGYPVCKKTTWVIRFVDVGKRGKWYLCNHRQCGSGCPVLISLVSGEFSTPLQNRKPWTDWHKIWHRWLRLEDTPYAKFGANPSTVIPHPPWPLLISDVGLELEGTLINCSLL